jgi:hypothetical protein
MFKRNHPRENGQSLVEFALTLPVLILILSGMLDIGRVYFTYIALEEAAAEAALYLAINTYCATSADPDLGEPGNPCANPNNARFRAQNAGAQELDWSRVTMFATSTGNQLGDIAIVRLQYPYEFITPGINSIVQNVTGGTGLILEVPATYSVLFEQ